MWVKFGDHAFYNVDQMTSLTATLLGAAYDVRAQMSNSTSAITLRTFATQAEADAWIAGVLTNVRED